jgi:hypothetical protein
MAGDVVGLSLCMQLNVGSRSFMFLANKSPS